MMKQGRPVAFGFHVVSASVQCSVPAGNDSPAKSHIEVLPPNKFQIKVLPPKIVTEESVWYLLLNDVAARKRPVNNFAERQSTPSISQPNEP
jgi:hypothetical protein